MKVAEIGLQFMEGYVGIVCWCKGEFESTVVYCDGVYEIIIKGLCVSIFWFYTFGVSASRHCLSFTLGNGRGERGLYHGAGGLARAKGKKVIKTRTRCWGICMGKGNR